MSLIKKGFWCAVLICLAQWSQAQDPLFTQFYQNPLYLNPAFTGTTDHYRAAAIFRRQWAAVPGGIETAGFGFDYNLDRLNSGIGLYATNDRIRALGLSATSIMAAYAYRARLSKKWQAHLGVSAGYLQQSLDFNRLVFGDQIDNGGGGSAEPMSGGTLGVPDFSAGMMLYNTTFWVGMAMHHLSNPVVEQAGRRWEIPARLGLHLGAKIPVSQSPYLRDRVFVSPALLYQLQGDASQLDMGVNAYYQPVWVGLWYRGLPIGQAEGGGINQDALAVVFGYQVGALKIGYSYDLTLSGLSARSGGSHEISVVLEPAKRNRNRGVQCPAFYNK